VDVSPVLGSRSTDTLSGIGPPPVRSGDVLPVGPPPREFSVVDLAPAPRPRGGALVLHALLGPREDWLAEPAALTAATWLVSSRSDRVGIRLQGPALRRSPAVAARELPSEGVVRGGIQVPSGGEPVLFLADHPVTGGYPVVAVVREDDLDKAAQVVPGQAVRISLVGCGPG
jgi:allophanate hydrolase subunit 2